MATIRLTYTYIPGGQLKNIEFENCGIEHLQEEVAASNGFVIRTHRLELYCEPIRLPDGNCTNCGRELKIHENYEVLPGPSTS